MLEVRNATMLAMVKTFADLEVYKNSKNNFLEVAAIVKIFPKEANYLVSQICRAANSIHANMAEGFGRSEAEFKQYLTRALGSNNEVISHLDDAFRLKYLAEQEFKDITAKYIILGKQIYRLRENWKKFG